MSNIPMLSLKLLCIYMETPLFSFTLLSKYLFIISEKLNFTSLKSKTKVSENVQWARGFSLIEISDSSHLGNNTPNFLHIH